MFDVLRPHNIVFRYEVPPEETTVPGAVVLRLRDGSQIIGQSEAAHQIAFAHSLLEDMEIHDPRQISVLIAPNPPSEKSVNEPQGPWIGADLLQRFGILEQLRGRVRNPFIPDTVGIYADVRMPVHVSPDNVQWPQFQELPLFFVFTFGAELVHEWAHVEQVRAGLPSYSLWSERHAMSEQAQMLFRILNRFSSLQKNTVRLILRDAHYYLQATYDYLNGRGFSDHLYEGYLEGTPIKDQPLYRD